MRPSEKASGRVASPMVALSAARLWQHSGQASTGHSDSVPVTLRAMTRAPTGVPLTRLAASSVVKMRSSLDGAGVGPVGFGRLASFTGYSTGFAVMAAVTVVALCAIRAHAHRPHEGASAVARGVEQRGELPGHLGENVTVSGVDWRLVVPGSRLWLGDDVLIEVTEYTTPCWKQAQWVTDGGLNSINAAVSVPCPPVFTEVLRTGLQLTAVGITIVFGALIVVSLALMAMNRGFATLERRAERAEAELAAAAAPPRDEGLTPQTLAVLAEYRDAGRIERLGLSAVTVEEIQTAHETVPIAAGCGSRMKPFRGDACARTTTRGASSNVPTTRRSGCASTASTCCPRVTIRPLSVKYPARRCFTSNSPMHHD